MDMIFTIGIFTSLFYFILLLNKKNKSLPDVILSIWMLVIGIHLTSTYFYAAGYWDVYPHLIGITVPFPFFYGPLLYLYVYHSLKDNHKLRKRDYLHFLPVVFTYLYMFRFYFFYSAEQKRQVDEGLIDDFGAFSNILVVAMLISAITYAISSYILLNRHKKLLGDNFSNTEHINLNWLKAFIWGVAIIFITAVIVLVSRDVMGISYPFNPEYIFYSMMVFAILNLGYFGIRHEYIFTDNVVIELEEKSKGVYTRSSLKDDVANDKHKTLIKLMEAQKPYLEPNLTLNALAGRLDISPNHLSQIINQFEDQNFNDFINKYRVEEFIDRAGRDKHLSFLGLALDSGFNSKSTFNAVFRKHKGVTPSQFMASRQKQRS
jgi:AraC-like DNA-binding protein